MAGDIEAAGDLVTGALWAQAVQPGGEAIDAAHAAAPLCLNCGTRLIGSHCHACGQAAHVHQSVSAIGHEILHGVFHVEGRIWRTLPMLVVHPGALTRRYIDGERARFLSPLALFLFAVFLFFAAISWVGVDVSDAVSDAATAQHAPRHLDPARAAKVRAAAARLEAQRGALVASGHAAVMVDAEIAALQDAADTAPGPRKSGQFPFLNVHTGWPALDHGIAKANADPGLAVYKLQSSAYKYSWLLIPLSTPVVALLFLWRRRFGLYDHAIFVTYSITFMLLLVTVLTLAGAIGVGGTLIGLAACLIPPIHLYKQLRGTYALRRYQAAWRMVILTGFAFCVLMAFVALLLLHGLTE